MSHRVDGSVYWLGVLCAVLGWLMINHFSSQKHQKKRDRVDGEREREKAEKEIFLFCLISPLRQPMSGEYFVFVSFGSFSQIGSNRITWPSLTKRFFLFFLISPFVSLNPSNISFSLSPIGRAAAEREKEFKLQ